MLVWYEVEIGSGKRWTLKYQAKGLTDGDLFTHGVHKQRRPLTRLAVTLKNPDLYGVTDEP